MNFKRILCTVQSKRILAVWKVQVAIVGMSYRIQKHRQVYMRTIKPTNVYVSLPFIDALPAARASKNPKLGCAAIKRRIDSEVGPMGVAMFKEEEMEEDASCSFHPSHTLPRVSCFYLPRLGRGARHALACHTTARLEARVMRMALVCTSRHEIRVSSSSSMNNFL